jgi:hypothetical protein
MTTTECNICTEKFNKVKHTPIKCEYCDFEACRYCCQTYILDKTQATCMDNNCNKEWSRKFLTNNFTQKFVNTDWKKNREQVIFDKEKALLPATQPIVERRMREKQIKTQIDEIDHEIFKQTCENPDEKNLNEQEKIIQKQIDDVGKKVREGTRDLKLRIHRINKKIERTEEKIRIEEQEADLKERLKIVKTLKENIDKEIRESTKKLRKVKSDLYIILRNPEHVENDASASTTQTRNFVRACPDENCRGFLSTQWKCGLCDQWTCPDCHVVKGTTKDATHTCDPNDIETAKLLDNDTKPCPKCATGIYKIEGCDQMWCTQCHTAFSWKTGHIETRIHNPHYFEFQRLANNGEAPRNPDENNFVCGQELDYRTTTRLKELLPEETPKQAADYLTIIIQSTLHLQSVQAPRYRVDDVENNQEHRVQYLQKAIDEPKFKLLIQQANKRHEKKREISEILGLFHQTMTEIILRLAEQLQNPETKKVETVAKYMDEIRGLQTYANECLKESAKTYGGKAKTIQFYEHMNGNVNHDRTIDLNYPRYNRDVLVTAV